MSWTAKTIWSEGMFLRPQHFQQHDRYLEALIEDRCSSLRPYAWGIRELEINEEALGLGKIDIARCRVVLADGTTVNIPAGDSAPAALALDSNTRDETIYLCLLAKRYGSNEVTREEQEDDVTRLTAKVMDVRDTSVAMDTSGPIELGHKNLKLLRENDERADYTCIGLVRVVEVRNDNTVVLDREYIPPALDCRDTPQLSGYIKDLQGLLKQRGERLAGRVGAAHGGTADTGDFMLLQTINRYQPLFCHLATLPEFHPESLYGICLQMAGELSTFTSNSKRPSEYPVYDHEDLLGSFKPLIAELREALTKVMVATAERIKLKLKPGDVYKADIHDQSLFDNYYWVLAINADMPPEEIRTLLPQQAKIGTTDQIADLVRLQIPGVGLSTLAQAPREIPYHAGFQYFELDRRGDMWKQIRESGALALHAGGNFPGIKFQMWAIKTRK
jgi:type VI secretion system protein ImpJ